ncbi:MAG: tetratricopeptide repeat protein [Candidatus Amoebophilus sp.]
MYAQNNLGDMYHKGWGVEKNDTKALEWYKRAANQGHEDAKLMLSTINLFQLLTLDIDKFFS